VDVAAEDADTEVMEILLVSLAMATKKKLKKQRLKPLFSDETLVEAVEDAAVMPLTNLVKTVSPKNLVILLKSLVTVTIAIDVDADEEARVILLVNLAMAMKKKLKKLHLKLLFCDET